MGRFPYLCGGCGKRIEAGAVCPCQIEANRARKARHDAKRPSARQRGYTSLWQQVSKAYLVVHPLCVMCWAPSTTVDHKIPHKGDDKLFWDVAGNWQALCGPCHSRTKQRLERSAVVQL